MKNKRPSLKKAAAAAVISVIVFAVTVLAYTLGAFDYAENKTYDLRVNLLAGFSRPSDDIILVLVNQDSIDWGYRERGWSWPWPRKAHAEFVDYMKTAGAKSVSYDVIFSEPSVYGADDDDLFVQSAAGYGRVVQTIFFGSQAGNMYKWPDDLDIPVFTHESFDAILPAFSVGGDKEAGALFPVDGLLYSAGAAGSITGRADSDGIFRRAHLFTLFDGRAVPGLSAAALLASGEENKITYDEKEKAVKWGDYTIPVDKNGAALLRFRGGLARYVPYSASEVLQSAEAYLKGGEQLLPPEDFEGKHVFFGYFAPGLFDIASTPISSTYPGVGMHVTMLDNILQGDFIRETPAWAGLAATFILILILSAVVLLSDSILISVAALLAGSALAAGNALYAYHAGYWFPAVMPASGALTAFLTATLYNYYTEGSQKRFIKSAFSQYLSPTVIEQLMGDPSKLTLGGERREISIFFSDIQGFTTISEKLDPTRLTSFLNEYLSFMSDIILDSGGTIDKYEGDAIIAFWNAPLSYEDHAARALSASLECLRMLEERQGYFEEKYGFRLVTRIGLNTGFAVVGNMGSSKRFDYTMLGDSVNLAARLEGLNKQFGTYIMCAEATLAAAREHGEFSARELASVAVVGKSKAVAVYEPMREEVFTAKKDIIEKFGRARDHFYKEEFSGALPLFEELAEVDRPSFFYAEQCRYYMKNPGEWKGFWQAAGK